MTLQAVASAQVHPTPLLALGQQHPRARRFLLSAELDDCTLALGPEVLTDVPHGTDELRRRPRPILDGEPGSVQAPNSEDGHWRTDAGYSLTPGH